jgi:hypothetical protein
MSYHNMHVMYNKSFPFHVSSDVHTPETFLDHTLQEQQQRRQLHKNKHNVGHQYSATDGKTSIMPQMHTTLHDWQRRETSPQGLTYSFSTTYGICRRGRNLTVPQAWILRQRNYAVTQTTKTTKKNLGTRQLSES